MANHMQIVTMLWIWFLGCVTGAGLYAWWLERQKPKTVTAPPPVIDEDEAVRRLELVMAAKAAMGRDLISDRVN